MPFGRAVEPQDKLVDPDPLGIVRGPVTGEVTLEMVHRLAPVCLHWQVTPGAGGRPGEVAGEAFHALLGMGQHLGLGWYTPPGLAVLLHRFSETGFFVVVPGLWINTIQHLHHFPLEIFGEHRALQEYGASISLAPHKASLAPRRIQLREVMATAIRRGHP